MKGGVGKTSTSVNLAYNFAKRGYRTLLWDLDSQGASSFYFKVKPKVKNIKKLVGGKISVSEYIKGSDYVNLDIMPADFSYRNFDILIDDAKKSKKCLKVAMEDVKDEYDIVVLDSPPTISALSDSIFYASDVILTPLIPTTLSVMTYEQLLTHLRDESIGTEKLFAFFSMVDVRKSLHKSIITSLINDNRFFKHLIPYSSVIERMGVHRAPVGEFEISSIANRSYVDFTAEIIDRFKL
jgi:cellulose biosynthesis protein BcsQ